jgi:ketosteroid isomerase-like protein
VSETIDLGVARLEALQAIRDLKNTYHTYVNETAFDKVPDLFTDDACVHLGYLMPGGQPWTGREQIRAAFSGIKSTSLQSQVKQFPHAHVVEITGDNTASDTSQLLALYGVGEDSYIVAGQYEEAYVPTPVPLGVSALPGRYRSSAVCVLCIRHHGHGAFLQLTRVVLRCSSHAGYSPNRSSLRTRRGDS